jgi:anti-sigma-K factor RskA
MTEEHIFDLLPGYALGILDDEDRLHVTTHLMKCSICARELKTYSAATDQLAFGVQLESPDPNLKMKVLQSVEAAARTSAPVEHDSRLPFFGKIGANWQESLRILLGRQAGLALAVLAIFLVLFLGINNYLLWQQVNDLQVRLPGDNVQFIRLDGTDKAPESIGYMIVFKNNRYGSLTVENVPVLDEAYQYQIWLMKDGERTNGGVFSVNDSGYGVLQVYSKQPLEIYDSFGITIEPAGGSPEPTGERILDGGL